MKNFSIFALRLAIGIGLLSAVSDRFGFWGHFGSEGVAWGNWDNFVDYTSVLCFGVYKNFANILGTIATIAEIVIGVLLILGYQLNVVAKFSGLLLLTFGLMMSINTNVKYALDYSVFVGCFASFLLSYQENFKWSIDEFLSLKNKKND